MMHITLQNLPDYFAMALTRVPKQEARVVEVAKQLRLFIQENGFAVEDVFQGELVDEWQYKMRWAKTKLKKAGVIHQSKKVGSKVYWSFVN